MRHSTDRILTTHVGSLPRPHDLLDVLKARLDGKGVDEAAFQEKLKQSVDDMVGRQAEAGIDIVADGEMSKPGHAVYINDRLEGFERRPHVKSEVYLEEREAFPEYYKDYFERAMLGGAIAPAAPMFCVGPIRYVGQDALRIDLANLRSAVEAHGCAEAFMPSAAVTGVGFNDYYATEEEYAFAVADALHEEYAAIIEAGFLLQVDDPFLPNVYMDKSLDETARIAKAAMYVDAINHSLRGIPEDQVRFHTCYGINQGPRIHEPDLPDMIDQVLRVNAGAYSFEAGNPRHEHEYHLWENVKLPDGKLIIPGVITHATSVVEHPQLVAERIVRFAERVGRENVIASADCGFSSQAMYRTEVEPRIVWAKFRALCEGAGLASKALWN
ncbi:cobalamin-independent methionine synthase II family protein [Microbaculum marinum]|uniref:Cobalamin-independent methionine synthase II family protein n=1 Tax=Microbaculum marinum TaxID=1764581 RepID=A0AAW9RB60_9HYPH